MFLDRPHRSATRVVAARKENRGLAAKTNWKKALAFGCLFFVALISFGAQQDLPPKISNADCLDCHTDPNNSKKVNGKTVPVGIFPTNRFEKSVHGKLNCVDCHVG